MTDSLCYPVTRQSQRACSVWSADLAVRERGPMRLLVWDRQLSCCPGYVTGREKAQLGGAVEPGEGEGGGAMW